MGREVRIAQSAGWALAMTGLALASCNGDNPVGPSSLAICDASPGPGRPELRFLQRPFRGSFPMTGYFDHDLPITFDMSQDTNGFVLTFCGERTGGQDGHPGYDWSLPGGTPLFAVADGVVLQAGEAAPQFCQALNRITTGLLVLLEHGSPSGEQFVSLAGHLSQVEVTPGEQVAAGQRIGLSGDTGCSLGPHLHFEVGQVVETRRVQIDPYGWKGREPIPGRYILTVQRAAGYGSRAKRHRSLHEHAVAHNGSAARTQRPKRHEKQARIWETGAGSRRRGRRASGAIETVELDDLARALSE